MSWPRTASTSVLGRRFYVRLDASKRLIGTGSAASSGTSISITVPSGTSDGDLAIYAGATRNNVPSASGPQGSGWTELYRDDVSSNEYGFVYWKICGSSEPATWDLTLGSTTSGTVNGVGAVCVFRGVSTVPTFVLRYSYDRGNAFVQQAPAVTSASGIVVTGYMNSFDQYTYTLEDSDASFDVTAAYGGENPRLAIGHYTTFLEGLPSYQIRAGLPPTSSVHDGEYSHVWTALLT